MCSRGSHNRKGTVMGSKQALQATLPTDLHSLANLSPLIYHNDLANPQNNHQKFTCSNGPEVHFWLFP